MGVTWPISSYTIPAKNKHWHMSGRRQCDETTPSDPPLREAKESRGSVAITVFILLAMGWHKDGLFIKSVLADWQPLNFPGPLHLGRNSSWPPQTVRCKRKVAQRCKTAGLQIAGCGHQRRAFGVGRLRSTRRGRCSAIGTRTSQMSVD
jgi:hypothetical protein